MKKSDSDSVLIYDRCSRRQFVRAGSTFLLAGGAATLVRPAIANECDRIPDEEHPKQAGHGSDSDSGSNGDPEGCGRRPVKPKITQYEQRQKFGRTVAVAKIPG